MLTLLEIKETLRTILEKVTQNDVPITLSEKPLQKNKTGSKMLL